MKKVFLIIIIMFPLIVKADTYYSDYYNVDSIELLDSDLFYVEEIKKYNTYIENMIDMGYLEDNDLYIRDDSDYIERTIKDKEYNIQGNQYISVSTNLKTMNLISLIIGKKNIKINEIKIYYEEEKIDYIINDNSIKNINDDDDSTYYINAMSNNSINLFLDKQYSLDKLKIVIDINVDEDEIIYLSVLTLKSLYLKKINGKYIITFNVNNKNDINEYYYDKYIKLYKYYKKDFILENKYVINGDNIVLDDYILENKYYKRDKLVLEDIIISNYEYSIEDYILYSNGDVIYNCDINVNNNGVYNCIFKLNNIEVDKEVSVNIIDNLNEKNMDNNHEITEDYLIEETSIENEKVIVKDEEKYTNFNQYNEVINDYIDEEVYVQQDYYVQEEKDLMYSDKSEVNRNYSDNKEVKLSNSIINSNNKKRNNNNKYRLIIVIVLAIFNIICIIKRKRNVVESI